ncbi:MAG: glycosyltransferase family 4 protein [Pontibacterium sp.]
MTASVHVVRRYSTKGGMEKYVWELTHALAELGEQVTVVCEQQEEPLILSDQCKGTITVKTLGVIKPKPRWRSMKKFSAAVSDYFAQHPHQGEVIHSHERTAVHHVTTIHGPSILTRKRRLLDALSPRLRTWEFLERREVLGEQVQCVLPNSQPIAEQLLNYYPGVKARLGEPALPGVSEAFYQLRETRKARMAGEPLRCVFIGKEWKRKGLDILADALAPLAQNHTLHLTVAGPECDEIAALFKQWPSDSYLLTGWAEPLALLAEADVLLHPARNEPFGMAIAEANAAGCRVLVSEYCGIAPMIESEMGQVLALDVESWRASLELMASETELERPSEISLTWQRLAERHVRLYRSLNKDRR